MLPRAFRNSAIFLASIDVDGHQFGASNRVMDSTTDMRSLPLFFNVYLASSKQVLQSPESPLSSFAYAPLITLFERVARCPLVFTILIILRLKGSRIDLYLFLLTSDNLCFLFVLRSFGLRAFKNHKCNKRVHLAGGIKLKPRLVPAVLEKFNMSEH